MWSHWHEHSPSLAYLTGAGKLMFNGVGVTTRKRDSDSAAILLLCQNILADNQSSFVPSLFFLLFAGEAKFDGVSSFAKLFYLHLQTVQVS